MCSSQRVPKICTLKDAIIIYLEIFEIFYLYIRVHRNGIMAAYKLIASGGSWRCYLLRSIRNSNRYILHIHLKICPFSNIQFMFYKLI